MWKFERAGEEPFVNKKRRNNHEAKNSNAEINKTKRHNLSGEKKSKEDQHVEDPANEIRGENDEKGVVLSNQPSLPMKQGTMRERKTR